MTAAKRREGRRIRKARRLRAQYPEPVLAGFDAMLAALAEAWRKIREALRPVIERVLGTARMVRELGSALVLSGPPRRPLIHNGRKPR